MAAMLQARDAISPSPSALPDSTGHDSWTIPSTKNGSLGKARLYGLDAQRDSCRASAWHTGGDDESSNGALSTRDALVAIDRNSWFAIRRDE
jgi:hypothetical protein